MTLTYLERLFCLTVVFAGTVHAGMEVLLHWAARPVLRVVAALRARSRERIVFALQWGPLLAGIFATGCVCVPQYLGSETNFGPERVSPISVLAGLLVVLWYGAAFLHGLRIALRTARFLRGCRRAGGRAAFLHGPIPVVVCRGMSGVALAGLLRPCILLSEDLTGPSGLSGTALEVVLDHECSHARQCDNWKLFVLNFLPTLRLRPSGGGPWRELWQNTAEWAADDDAARGDSGRPLVLAETLVSVARKTSSHPPMVWATLACGGAEFAARIDRLLVPRPCVRVPRRWWVLFLLSAVAAGAAGVAAGRKLPLDRVPEHLLHLR